MQNIFTALFLHIVREPGGVNLAGKETNFLVHKCKDRMVWYNEWIVWHVLCGGCGQGEGPKWSKFWARSAGKETLRNLYEKIRHSPKVNEWPMPDVLSGGGCPPDAPKGGPKIELDQLDRKPLETPGGIFHWDLYSIRDNDPLKSTLNEDTDFVIWIP